MTVTATGPCGYSATYAAIVRLQAGEARTASTTVTAPACARDYAVWPTWGLSVA